MLHELYLQFRDYCHWTRLIYGVGLVEFVRYSLAAGGASLLFYVILRRRWLHRKIVSHFPPWGDVWREVVLSGMTCVVYALVGLFTFAVLPASWNHYYENVDEYGWAWFWASIVLTIFLHDAYFYWTHRLMHHRWLYPIVHKAHHRSTNPTSWAAYAFDPVEAAVQAGIFPLVVMLYPLHPGALIIFMAWQVTYNVLGHTGYEVFPSWFLKSWLGKFFNTPTNHAMHHQYFRGNYGLYFNLWDRWCGTNHAKYEERFAEVTARKAAAVEDGVEIPCPAEVEKAG